MSTLQKFKSDALSALADCEGEIDGLIEQKQALSRAPRSREHIESAMLSVLIDSAARGAEAINERFQEAQRRDRPAGADLLWNGTVDSDVISWLLQKELAAVIRDRCKSLPPGISDDERAAELTKIQARLDELRLLRDRIERSA